MPTYAYRILRHTAIICNHYLAYIHLRRARDRDKNPFAELPCQFLVNLCSGVLTLLAQELHCDMKRRLGTAAKTYLETGEQTTTWSSDVKCFGPTTCQAIKNSCFHGNVCLEESLVRQKLKPGSVEYLSGLWYVMAVPHGVQSHAREIREEFAEFARDCRPHEGTTRVLLKICQWPKSPCWNQHRQPGVEAQ